MAYMRYSVAMIICLSIIISPKLSDYALDRQRAPRMRAEEPKIGPDSRFNHPDADVEDNLSGYRGCFD